MGKSRTSQAIMGLLDSALESPVYGKKLLEGVGVDPRRLTQVAPIDDGNEPLAPQGFEVTPYLAALFIDYAPPPITDHVDRVVIEYTPQGKPAVTVSSRDNQPMIEDLSPVPHSVRIKYVDLWGRESLWSATKTATPLESADYAINLEKARQTGNLTNLITAINASAIDPNNLSETMVKQVALAQGTASNLLPLIETDFTQWDNGQAWPPPDSSVAGTPYITAAASNVTATVITRSGNEWLRTIQNANATGFSDPFTKIGQRGTFVGQEYIASVFVDGAAGTKAQLVVVGSASDGTGAVVLGASPQTTMVSENGGLRIHCKFKPTSAAPFVRLRLQSLTPNGTLYWTRLQIELADGKTEPGPWNSGVFTTGVIGAKMLTAIDLNAANALFKNAAIDSAKIKEITANKITTGTITAGMITLAGGALKAGQIVLDNEGITMPRDLGQETSGGVNRAYKIGSPDNRQVVSFYDNDVDRFYGVAMRSDGNGGTRRGALVLNANHGSTISRTSAQLDILGGDFTPAGEGIVQVSRGEFYSRLAGGTTIAANTSTRFTWATGLGHNPTVITFMVQLANGNWRLLPTSPSTGSIDVFVTNINSGGVTVTNLSASPQVVYGTVT